jgi:septal ring factor EnvC (AmiA/AmiB activator)
MNAEDFNEETRRERLEEERIGRTLEDEIEDRESDIRDLHASLEDYVQRLARATEALASHRVRLREANARNEAQRDELERLRGEHEAAITMRAVPDTRSPEFIDAYRPWADAHDRTELAK